MSISLQIKPSNYFGAGPGVSICTVDLCSHEPAKNEASALAEKYRGASLDLQLDEILSRCLELLGSESGRTLVMPEFDEDAPVLVVGDVHGDLDAMCAVLAFASHITSFRALSTSLDAHARPRLAFLGDFLDRGEESAACIALALQQKLDRPSETIVIPGNHEISLGWTDDESCFRSDVEPDEFATWLSEGAWDNDLRKLAFGSLLIHWAKRAPRVAILPNGTLLTHGGVPHADVLGSLKDLDALDASDLAREDLSWTRLHRSTPNIIPNRARRGCGIGVDQFTAAVSHLSSLAFGDASTRSVRNVVRGHDHSDRGFDLHPEAFPPGAVITVNSMGTGSGQGDARVPCVVLLTKSYAPCVIRLVVASAKGSESESEIDVRGVRAAEC